MVTKEVEQLEAYRLAVEMLNEIKPFFHRGNPDLSIRLDDGESCFHREGKSFTIIGSNGFYDEQLVRIDEGMNGNFQDLHCIAISESHPQVVRAAERLFMEQEYKTDYAVIFGDHLGNNQTKKYLKMEQSERAPY
jgi:hypothetical protein